VSAKHDSIEVVATRPPVGLTRGARGRLAPAADIAARFFSRREKEARLALDSSDQPPGRCDGRTRKGAFVVPTEYGLPCAPDTFNVSLSPETPARLGRHPRGPAGDLPQVGRGARSCFNAHGRSGRGKSSVAGRVWALTRVRAKVQEQRR